MSDRRHVIAYSGLAFVHRMFMCRYILYRMFMHRYMMRRYGSCLARCVCPRRLRMQRWQQRSVAATEHVGDGGLLRLGRGLLLFGGASLGAARGSLWGGRGIRWLVRALPTTAEVRWE